MKKIFFGMMAMVALVATSCQQDVDLGVQAGETTTVAFNLATPQIATKADFSDGTTATHLQYAVYDANQNILDHFTVTDGEIHTSTSVEFQLTTGNTYYVLFWAAAPNAPYTVDLTAKSMEVSYANATSSDENRDAFYYYDSFTVTSGMAPISAELRRPFAQLNIGTNDYDESTLAGYTVTAAKVTVPVYTTLNFSTGLAEGMQEVTFDYAAIPTSQTFPVAGYEYLAMNYLLMNTTKENVDVKFQYTNGTTAQAERTVGSVPVQRNHRTNLYGQLLTTDVDVNVEIKPEYDEPAYNEEIVNLKPIVENGVTVPGIGIIGEDETTGYVTYGVTSAEGLNWVSNKVQNPVATVAEGEKNYVINGNTVKLLNNITLPDGFYPIGYNPTNGNVTTYEGTFDGNGKTIYNLNRFETNGSRKSIGLFSQVKNATVKNLTLEDFVAAATRWEAAAIACVAVGNCVFENITLKNGSVVTYNNDTAGIVGWANVGNFTFRDITIGSDVTIHSIWGSYDTALGGVVGTLESGSTALFDNVNIACKLDAYNDCCANYKYYAYRRCGMLIGNMSETQEVNGTTYPNPAAAGVTCVNVTVTYGDWMNYHYCEFQSNGQGSYDDEFTWTHSRVEGSEWGRESNIDTDNCQHQSFESHNVCYPIDQLFGGGQGVYGLKAYEGVTVNYPASYNPEN